MKDITNKIHHCDFLQNNLSDKSVNLIIADFPYFKVKGEFDFIWKRLDANTLALTYEKIKTEFSELENFILDVELENIN